MKLIMVKQIKSNNKLKRKLKYKNEFLVAKLSVNKNNNSNSKKKQTNNKVKPRTIYNRKLNCHINPAKVKFRTRAQGYIRIPCQEILNSLY